MTLAFSLAGASVNWAVLDMDRRLVVAGDRLFFFVHFNDGTGQKDTRAILENAARTLWASLEEYDSSHGSGDTR